MEFPAENGFQLECNEEEGDLDSDTAFQSIPDSSTLLLQPTFSSPLTRSFAILLSIPFVVDLHPHEQRCRPHLHLWLLLPLQIPRRSRQYLEKEFRCQRDGSSTWNGCVCTLYVSIVVPLSLFGAFFRALHRGLRATNGSSGTTANSRLFAASLQVQIRKLLGHHQHRFQTRNHQSSRKRCL